MQNNYAYVVARQIVSFFKEEDFIRKIKVTLSMILLYRFLYFIPLPGINFEVLDAVYGQTLQLPGFLSMFLGNIKELSILSLGISSYITCSLVSNFAHLGNDYLKELKKDGAGRSTLNSYVRYASFVHAFLFGLAGAVYIRSWRTDLVLFPSIYFTISTALFVATGAMITIWIADQISINGIGNGSSIIIFINIISVAPKACQEIIKNLKSGVLEYKIFALFMVFLSCLLFVIVYGEKVYREYKVINISKKSMAFKMLPENSLIMKLNPAGILPAMFLGHILVLPSLMKSIWDYTQYYYGALFANSFESQGYMFVLAQGIILMLCVYTFAEAVFNPEEKAREFKSRTMIPGVRPGEETKIFLENKLFIMSLIGGVYLAIVCCVPSLLGVYLKNSNFSKVVVDIFNIQGVSLIIVVGVIHEFIDKIVAGINYKLTDLSLSAMHRKF